MSIAPTPTTHPNAPPPTHRPPIQTYHCICATHILTTPYSIPTLPQRAPPSLDKARILPLPALDIPPPSPPHSDNAEPRPQCVDYLPSLLHNLRPARKVVVVQREHGWERRRLWRCGRCGTGVGYEIEGAGAVKVGAGANGRKEREEGKVGMRVLYLLEEGIVSTESMMAGGQG